MTIKINFDVAHNPEKPTLVLAKRNGDKLGKLNAKSIEITEILKDFSEISFSVYKYTDNKITELWDDIVDFKLVYCVEWDMWFEITVEINESSETMKTVFCTRLGHAELSQIMLYNIEINTENDIARVDYIEPTVFYNQDKPEISLLNRIMEKAPHYEIAHVDESLWNIQRTFTFDSTSIVDAHNQISEEIHCLFVYDSNSDENNNIRRTISVYDLESTCLNPECDYLKDERYSGVPYRGEFTGKCPYCGSENVFEGYGKDTTIFVTSDELSEEIQFNTDTDAVKNCFKLEAGDDLMTATIRNCNPNGTDYIWYISEHTKKDMEQELVDKLEEYDELYQYYQKDYISYLNESIVNDYNDLVDKYLSYNEDLDKIPSSTVGYPALMNAYYNAIDMELFLTHELMPVIPSMETNALKELESLTNSISPVSVSNLNAVSEFTAKNAILSMAKVRVDSRYDVIIEDNASLDKDGTIVECKVVFHVQNKYNEDDKAESVVVSVVINDEYKDFVQQKVDKFINKENVEDLSISGLFAKSLDDFKKEIKKYGLSYLERFYDCCQGCIDILIEQGIGNKATWSGQNPNLYDDLYIPYKRKLKALDSEISVRKAEIEVVTGIYKYNEIEEKDEVVQDGMQTILDKIISEIQTELNFEDYLGTDLWLDFCAYRREDKYTNSNYISEGLDNAELFKHACEFIATAEKEIYRSAELQHSISTTLKNLLAIKKFEPLINDFQVGNWLRIMVDDKIYKLRLISYSIDYDDLNSISVEFSDVLDVNSTANDIKGILSQASTMATTYNSVQRQAQQGSDSNTVIKGWFENGLDATNTMIVGGADDQTQTWDEHGMLFRKYDSIEEEYDDIQLKIINSTIAITDDNWETVKTAVGAYYYFHPTTGKLTMAYGVNAETIVGKLLIGEGLLIANESNTFVVDEYGAKLTNASFVMETSNGNSKIILDPQEGIKIQGMSNGLLEDKFYVDENGNVILKGALTAGSTITGATFTGGSLNIGNGNFIVDENGNVTAKNGTFSGTILADKISGKVASNNIVDTLNNKALVGGSLNIGNGAFVVDNAGNVTIKSGSISWGAVTGTDEIDNRITNAQNTANNAVDLADAVGDDIILLAKGEYTKAGKTFISGTNVYSPNITGGTITGATIVSTSGNKKATLTNSKLTFRVEGNYSYDVGYIQAYDDGAGTTDSAGHGLRISGLWNGAGYNGGIQINSSDYAGVSLYAGTDIFFWVDGGEIRTSIKDILNRIENASGSGTAVFG